MKHYEKIPVETENIGKTCTERLAADPNDYEALFPLAYHQTDLHKRIVMLNIILSKNPNHIDSLRRKAYDLDTLGTLEETQIHLQYLRESLKMRARVRKLEREKGIDSEIDKKCFRSEYNETLNNYKKLKIKLSE